MSELIALAGSNDSEGQQDGRPAARRSCCQTIFILGTVVLLTFVINICLAIYFPTIPSLFTQIHGHFYPDNLTPNLLSKAELQERRELVLKMTHDAWYAYSQNGWGKEAIKSNSSGPFQRSDGVYRDGLTIVESLSTLWLLGMKKEFEAGKKWVEYVFDPPRIYDKINTAEAVTIYMGSLLSCYALTKDTLFLTKAQQLAEVIKLAYDFTKNGFPYSEIPISNSDDYQRTLAKYGGQHLELRYLSDLNKTGDDFWKVKSYQIRVNLKKRQSSSGLYSTRVYESQRVDHFSLQRNAHQFYSYLIKAFIQSNSNDVDALDTYLKAFKAAESAGMLTKSKADFVYTNDVDIPENGSTKLGAMHAHPMQFEGCSLGATLALGMLTLKQHSWHLLSKVEDRLHLYGLYRNMDLAEGIVKTCQTAARKTTSGMVPGLIYFEDGNVNVMNDKFYLTPEMAESIFVLSRLTKDPIYFEYAWEMAKAINSSFRSPIGGFQSAHHFQSSPSIADKYQPPSFIGGTLKYLYLTFAPDLLPLEKWVLNAVGQPLPICGQHPTYPKGKCG